MSVRKTGKTRNPPWSRDELILALNLYFRAGRRGLDNKHPDVIELSEFLALLSITENRPTSENFRNPNSVAMKLANFSSSDPEYVGKGLEGGGRLDKEIWKEFADDPVRLGSLAASIREGVIELDSTAVVVESEDDGFLEGRVLERVHKVRERNRPLVLKKLKKVKAETGRVRCEVCDFDFFEVYGELGEDFAECHHRVPISEMSTPRKTKLEDLSVVCSNCHRVVHRSKPMLSIEQLRDVVRSRRRV